MTEEFQEYGPIRAVGENIYCVDGEWYDSPLKRRMTIIRLGGSLVLHSAIRMKPVDLAKLDALGKVSVIVIPNIIHFSDAPFYKRIYPEAQVYVPQKLVKKSEKKLKVTGSLEGAWPYNDELLCISFTKTFLSESAFIHRESKTLILTDMAFNVKAEDFKNPIEKLILGQWNGILDQFGPSRLCRYVAASNKHAVREGLRQIKAEDFHSVIVSHGAIVTENAKSRFIDSYNRRYGLSL